MSDQDDLAANAYLELKHEIEKRGAISSDRVKKIVMEHLGLQRLRRQRIDPILQLGVEEGIWDWGGANHTFGKHPRNPYDITKAEEKDEQAVTCSEELEEYEALLASNAHPNALDNWRQNHPVPEEEETKVRRRPRRSPITAALTEADILPEEEKEVTYSTGTKTPVYESDCRECALPVPKGCTFCSPSCEAEYNHKATLEVEFESVEEEEEGPAYTLLKDRKGVLDYTLRELLDAIIEHIRSK